MANANATSTWSEMAQELEENASTFWKPEVEGASIAGKILTVEENAGKNADSILVELETEDKMTVGVWLSTVLEREWQRQKPEIGDVIGIKYFGRKTGKSGHEYKSFALKVFQRGEGFEDDLPF